MGHQACSYDRLMKAIVQDVYGPPDALQLKEIDRPAPADGEMLVRVCAASVNARDWHVMRGDPYVARLMPNAYLGLSAPKVKIRGTDFAGVVEEVGLGVTRFRPGDEVFGEVQGAFAEYVTVPDDRVDTKPCNLTFEQAAAMPTAANTALVLLRDGGHVKKGQHILINGASGGVGTFAVQIAKDLAADVTAVVSTRNADLMGMVGADQVIDYKHEDFAGNGKRYDVVVDLVGNRSLTHLRHALTPTGTLVLSGGGVSRGGSVIGPMGLFIKGLLAARFINQRVVGPQPMPSRANFAMLRELAESGKITPIIDRTYSLSEVPAAIRYLETEHARAKVVITM